MSLEFMERKTGPLRLAPNRVECEVEESCEAKFQLCEVLVQSCCTRRTR